MANEKQADDMDMIAEARIPGVKIRSGRLFGALQIVYGSPDSLRTGPQHGGIRPSVKGEPSMLGRIMLSQTLSLLLLALISVTASAQAQPAATAQALIPKVNIHTEAMQTVQVAAPGSRSGRVDQPKSIINLPLNVDGTSGRIAKFITATAIGDSVITETSSSNVGIVTTDPYAQLTLTGSLGFTNDTTPMMFMFKDGVTNPERPIISHSPAFPNVGLTFRDNDDDKMVFRFNENVVMAVNLIGNRVGIGTINPAFKLDVAGAAHASSFPTSSDARLKTNVAELTNVLEKLETVRGVSFDWNESYQSLGRATGHREIGVIAQEVEAVFPELVSRWGEQDYRAVDYGRLTGVLIEAVKELRAEKEVQITTLKAENITLKQQNAALETRLDALEQMVQQLNEQRDKAKQ